MQVSQVGWVEAGTSTGEPLAHYAFSLRRLSPPCETRSVNGSCRVEVVPLVSSSFLILPVSPFFATLSSESSSRDVLGTACHVCNKLSVSKLCPPREGLSHFVIEAELVSVPFWLCPRATPSQITLADRTMLSVLGCTKRRKRKSCTTMKGYTGVREARVHAGRCIGAGIRTR